MAMIWRYLGLPPASYADLCHVDLRAASLKSAPFFGNNFSSLVFGLGSESLEFFTISEVLDGIDMEAVAFTSTVNRNNALAKVHIFAQVNKVDREPRATDTVGNFRYSTELFPVSSISDGDCLLLSCISIQYGDIYYTVSLSDYEEAILYYPGLTAVQFDGMISRMTKIATFG
ncbi:hypothetical protein [Rhizobium terrae]|uniref:hypothetical protein n=1 Tax=Rhizobium terrae TaxID=2171756 RepID=UPI0013C3070C|nr:hypothetical protein [Rhizobium terrae]